MGQYQYGRKRTWVNGGLIALNILYFLYLEIAGSSEDTVFMLQHGAMYAPMVLQDHEYYRLLTSVFMHFGIDHIVNNMLVLFVLGDNLERALGKVKYLLFYLLCGVGANIVSMLIGIHDSVQAVGAGASGAIFGVIGGLLYAVGVNRGRLEDLSSRQLVVVILFSLYFGFTSTGVDNVAHVAGLLIGVLLAAILYRKPQRSSGLEYWG
ncbi:MAG: rhomboid family intramembrane serine protease [Lachnospiraceae bacterium]|nr:rhomboid family intramembrane serine protease [Lachnospiraceae bacterium]